MTKRVIDLGREKPFLDMPNAAYREACRPRYYAEVGLVVFSWRTPFTVARERFSDGCARVVRHSFSSSQRAEELQ